MKKPFLTYFFALLSITFFFSCATIVAPTGGAKDETPPQPLRFFPPQNSTSFNGNKITITFDEFFKVDNIKKHLLISPPMKEDPTFKTMGKSLVITLADTLKENTTYRIYMGEAIVDLHEGNPIKNFDYTFSTGTEIDSLEIKGKVVDAYTQEPVSNVLVMLYKNGYDSIPMKEIPDYLSRTDDNGFFVFKNLQKGEFMIFALSDINANYLFDLKSEPIAYYDSIITPEYVKPISDSLVDKKLPEMNVGSDMLTLSLFKEMDTMFRYEQYIDANRLASIGFNQPVNDLDIEVIHPKAASVELEEIKPDSVNIWLYQFEKDTLLLQMKSKSKEINDTLLFTYFPTKRDTKRMKNKKLDVKLKHPNYSVFYQQPVLVFQYPLDTLSLPEKIQLIADTDTTYCEYQMKDLRSISLTHPWQEEVKSYKVYIPDSLFKDRYGSYNVGKTLRLVHTPKSEFGTLILQIDKNEQKHKDYSYILQLLEKEK
ncbi:MAG: hypothetical protein CSA94_01920, partial [Bacteroidetes bacterium]